MWPELSYSSWNDTLETLHMWMEIVGKVKLALAPFLNQWWEVAFFVTPTGMTSGNIPYNNELFEVNFDFLQHVLLIHTSWNKAEILPLKSQSVAAFYEEFIHALKRLGITVSIWSVPVEIQHPIPFPQDTTHASYNKEHVVHWWKILIKANIIFEKFRSSFDGKNSPVQFFWGSFDLSNTRFSGKKATPPKMSGVMENIMKYAENEENFAFGFWPGDERFPAPAFYSYMYPKPAGIESIQLEDGASFNDKLSECILPYDNVRKLKHPEERILHFLNTSYKESAHLAKWDIPYFQTDIPKTVRHQ